MPQSSRDDASIVPYRGCNNAGLRFSGSPRGLPRPVGRAFTPAAPRRFQNRNVHPVAGCGGMRASRPTVVRVVAAVPDWPETQNLFVGAGFIPPAGVCPTAGFPGAQCAPLQGARWGWLCGWPQVFPSARRGGFHIRPQTSRHRKPGRYRIGPYNISTKIFIPPKKPETPPTHKTQKPKNQKSPPKTTTPARQPFSLNGRRAGFSCQVFLATLITGYPVCPCVFCPQAAPQWPPPPRSARRAPPPAGTCRWSAARTTARRSASGLRPRCRP